MVATSPRLSNYAELLDGVRELLPVPPLLGVDQEGGLVDRLRKIFTPMPSARTIREHGDLSGARSLGRITGEALRLLGFNMNFAPVMSIMTEERDLLSNGLYSRSFGRSPGEVLGYTTVYLRGLQETGMIGCLKHFPGIGAGEVDSHEQMPMVQLSHDDLMAQDLAPYIELFQRKDDRVRCVMVSHGGFPNIDIMKGVTGGLLEPASLSHNIVTNSAAQRTRLSASGGYRRSGDGRDCQALRDRIGGGARVSRRQRHDAHLCASGNDSPRLSCAA